MRTSATHPTAYGQQSLALATYNQLQRSEQLTKATKNDNLVVVSSSLDRTRDNSTDTFTAFKNNHSVLAEIDLKAPFTSFDAVIAEDYCAIQEKFALGYP